LSNSCIYSILEDKAGTLWFATEKNGVWRYDGKSFTNLTTKDGLGHNSVFCIVEDDAGRIWFGTRNVGLCRYDGKMFTEFSGVRSQP
jgi:ligand-binding sensor domain-containing protein